jgi:hypothetical protein
MIQAAFRCCVHLGHSEAGELLIACYQGVTVVATTKRQLMIAPSENDE